MFFILFLTQSFSNSCNFLSDRVITIKGTSFVIRNKAPFNHAWHYNEVTFEKPLEMGGRLPVNRACDQRFGIFSPNPQLLGREVGLEVELVSGQWFNQPCPCNEASVKTLSWRDSKSFQVGENTEVLGRLVCAEGKEAPCRFPPTSPYAPLPSGCSWVYPFVKTSNLVGKPFLWVLWTALANYGTWERGCGNLWSILPVP